MRHIAFTLLLATFFTNAIDAAEFKLAGIFMDHAVLQRGINVPVWGWAPPGGTVTVSFAGQKHSTTADASGKWSVKLGPMKASAEGRQLTASSGGKTTAIADIVVGEVWHASGQSNMDGHTLTRNYEDHPRGQKAINAADTSVIRYCNIDMLPSGVPQEDLNEDLLNTEKRSKARPWTRVNRDTAGGCKAIAYFFAQRLYQELNVPIGIIATPKGGAMIELFVPAETYRSLPSFKDGQLQKLEGQQILENFQVTSIYNSRIHPIAGYGIAGMIWYQGESNTRADAKDYSEKLSLMVRGFRKVWGQGDFPFYYVQLCAHGAGEEFNDLGWPIVQDQMRIALKKIPNAGMAITNDINGHHPTNKLDGGERLAAWALAKTYKHDIPHCGPLFISQTVEDNKVSVSFEHAGSGLMLCEKDGISPPVELHNESSKMFELAGEDEKWHQAEARLVGSKVELRSASVPNPLYVRYAFRESLSGPRVYNRDGFPMSTFTSRLLDSDLTAQMHYYKYIKPERMKKKRARSK